MQIASQKVPTCLVASLWDTKGQYGNRLVTLICQHLPFVPISDTQILFLNTSQGGTVNIIKQDIVRFSDWLISYNNCRPTTQTVLSYVQEVVFKLTHSKHKSSLSQGFSIKVVIHGRSRWSSSPSSLATSCSLPWPSSEAWRCWALILERPLDRSHISNTYTYSLHVN